MKEKNKTPLIRLAKRVKTDMMSPRKVWAIRIGSIVFAFILGMIPIIMAGQNPFQSYGIIISGALSKPGYIRQTVKRAIPLLGVALAIAPCFKMKFWNIGAEGQMLSGTKDDNYYWYSAKANLDNAATLQFYFMAPNGIEGLTVEIGGVEYTIHSTSTSGKHYVEITQMSAGDFRKVLTAKFKLNGTETGQAFSYSMNTYVSQVENHATFGSLAQRLYNYGKSAYNYAN